HYPGTRRVGGEPCADLTGEDGSRPKHPAEWQAALCIAADQGAKGGLAVHKIGMRGTSSDLAGDPRRAQERVVVNSETTGAGLLVSSVLDVDRQPQPGVSIATRNPDADPAAPNYYVIDVPSV